MEKEVHERGDFVAVENVKAVAVAAGAGQVIDIHSGIQRPETHTRLGLGKPNTPCVLLAH